MKIRDMEALVRIAETGSMSQAARQLGVTPAAVSGTLQRVERALGLRLFERTTRSLRPTAEGLVVLEGCRELVARWHHVLDDAHQQRGGITGTVHLSAPADTSYRVLGPIVAAVCDANPELDVIMNVSDAIQHVHREQLDIAIRYGALPDSSLSARKLASSPSLLVASPAYLAAHGTPRSPGDLSSHRLLALTVSSARPAAWTLSQGDTAHTVPVRHPLRGDGYLVRRWALQGRGIGLKSLFDVIDELESGELVEALPGCRGALTPIHAVYPSHRFLPARVRVLSDAITAQFAARAARCRAWLST